MYKSSVFVLSAIVMMACFGQKAGEQSPTKSSAENTQITPEKSSKEGLQNLYSRAIADYITEVHKQNLMLLDTLYFGKRNNGQPDDFPDISLPASIKNVSIQLIDPDLGKKLQEAKKSRVYINLMGWVEDQQASFIFVTFSNGFEHKFDYHVEYQYHSEQKDHALTSSRIEVFSK